MNSAAIPAVAGIPEAPRAAELGSAVDTSLVTLPETRMSVDARGLALGVLAALALIFALSWAEKFLVPLLLGIVIAYTLNPLVVWLEAIRIPRVGNVLWEGSMGALVAMGQAAMVVFLVFFLLLGGDQFKRKLVRLTGPSLSNKKITVNILDDINGSIQKYMFMLLTTNLLVALLTWIALRWIGLENAGAWAVAAGLLHIVPYLGPSVTAAATGMAAFMQFESFSMALLVAGASLTIATVVGTFVTTWMIGRIANMNSAAIFISLLFWGWLWGVGGMLLSIPIIVIVKVVSQHVEQLQPMAELLGD